MDINNFFAKKAGETEAMKKLSLILMGHSAFQILNAGCELGIFEQLNKQPGLTKVQISQTMKLEERPLDCILLGLTSLELIKLIDGKFFNGETIEDIFSDNFWETFYNIVRFESKIVYLGQYDFVDSLKENRNIGLKRIDGNGPDLYHRLAENEISETAFFNYMSSWSAMAIPLLINSGIFSASKKILDIGGGDGTNAIEIARHNPNAKVTIFELKENSTLSRQKVALTNLQDRIKVVDGNMFTDDFGGVFDCIIFIHIMVIWSKEQVKSLLKKSYDALENHGKLIIFNSMSSDQEDGPLFAALDSVYFMSIPSNGGMIYPWKFYEACLIETGFQNVEKIDFNVWSPHGAIVATK